MSTRLLRVSTLCVSGLLLGCHHDQPAANQRSRAVANAAATTQPSVTAKSAVAQDPPVVIDAPSTADSVAQKARAYAAQMERAMNDPARVSAARLQATLPAAQQSAVKWVEPQTNPEKNQPVEHEVHSVPLHETRESVGTVSNTGLAIASPAGIAARPRQELAPPQIASAVNPPKLVVDPPRPAVTAAAVSSDDLAQRLAQHVKDYPQDLSGQLDLQLYQFSRGDSVPNVQVLAGLAGEDRELLAAILDGLSNFRSALRADNNMLFSRKVSPLLEVADRLRTQAELTVPVVALCSRVETYGKYEPMQPLRFVAGVEHEVIVYCEVENFSSQLDSQKMWETSLRQDIVLYSDQGIQVWTPDKVAPRPSVDRSRARHHDFFLGRKIHLPANLSIGGYILKVSVIDQQVNRVAENTVALEIVAQ